MAALRQTHPCPDLRCGHGLLEQDTCFLQFLLLLWNQGFALQSSLALNSRSFCLSLRVMILYRCVLLNFTSQAKRNSQRSARILLTLPMPLWILLTPQPEEFWDSSNAPTIAIRPQGTRSTPDLITKMGTTSKPHFLPFF